MGLLPNLANGKSAKSNKFNAKRLKLRNALFPDAAPEVWDRRVEKGFTTIPRTIPLFMLLMKELSKKESNGSEGNPGMVYLELWSRSFDEGFISIKDPAEHAYASGYTSSRAERTWRDQINKLAEWGFIKVNESGNKSIAHVLLINPYKVVRGLKQANRVPIEWWSAFATECSRIGADIDEVI